MIPYKIPNSPLSEKNIKKILMDVGLKFSRQNIQNIFYVVERYPLDKHLLEELKINKVDQLKQLEELITAAKSFRSCIMKLSPYIMLNPVLTHKAEVIAEEMEHAAGEAIESSRNNPIKRGRKKLHARLLLIQKLISIFEDETKENFIRESGVIGRGEIKEEYTKYDSDAFNFIFNILCTIEPNFNKNRLQKDLESIIEKPYDPTPPTFFGK